MTRPTLALALTMLIGCAEEDKDTAASAGVQSTDTGDAGDTGTQGDEAAGPSFVPLADDGASVQAVEPERYLGLWYEIATTPSFQQTRCVGTTAQYSLRDDGLIGVTNRCYLDSLDGPLNQIEGTAKPVDDTFARLLVDLGVGFTAPYNVVELDGTDGDAPYDFAVVSSGGRALWVLHRQPQMDPELYELLVERALDAGLPALELIPTEQPAAQ